MHNRISSLAKFLAIAWNDVRIEFSERSTIVFFLILPLVFTSIIGFGLKNMYDDDPTIDRRYVALVIDEDQSELSARLIAALEASDVARPLVKPRLEAEQFFAEESVPAMLTIPAGFEADLLAGKKVELLLLRNPENNQAYAVSEAINAAVTKTGGEVAIAISSRNAAEALRPFDSDEERQAYMDASFTAAGERLSDPPVTAEVTVAEQATVEIATGFEQASPGQLVTWTMITLVGAAEVFVNERVGGTLRRLMVTPTRKATVLLGKVTGRLFMGLLQMVILVGFGGLVLGVNWGRSPLALGLVIFCFALAAVALGVMLGAFARTRAQASGLTVMVSMLFSALGGAWWPMEITPPAYQAAVKVLPTTWAMAGFNDVILRGQGVDGILLEAGILLAFAVVFFVVGMGRLRAE